MVSSPGRFAAALNLTEAAVAAHKVAHLAASGELHRLLTAPDSALPPAEKNVLKCRHRLQFGQHPFVCPRCW
jgi:hypothetical protein